MAQKELSEEKKTFKKKVTPAITSSDGSFLHGKVPPQAVDLEEAVLGALMLEKDALTAVIDFLKPEVFYKDAHRHIFEAIKELFERSEPIDILTVTAQLRKNGTLEVVGGAYYISQLTNRVASSANVEFHSRIILQKHIQRELIRISSEIIKDSFEDTTDVFTLLDRAERNLYSVTEGNTRKNYEEMKPLIMDAIKQIEIAKQHESGITGVPSGFTELDRVTSGWQKSDLIIIAARPGMGKTAFVLSLAKNTAVDFKKPIGFFSLEMSAQQLVTRLISSETELPADKLRRGDLKNHEWEQLNAKINTLIDAPIYIDDTPALSIFELRAKCRRLKAHKKIELVVVDYLQLMTAFSDSKGNSNREQEISTISRSLKSIAKELNIPIIVLSQLSREVEKRGGEKKPVLSDLRESGAIEQDADMVIFIYRPEAYGMDQDDMGNTTKGYTELRIAKNRNGSVKNVPIKFIGHLMKFVDADTNEYFEDVTAPLPQPDDFNSPNKITRSSKMNDMEEGAPF